MQAMAISSDFRAFNLLAHFLQIWAVRPLPENFSFGRIFLHILQKCPRYCFFFAIICTLYNGAVTPSGATEDSMNLFKCVVGKICEISVHLWLKAFISHRFHRCTQVKCYLPKSEIHSRDFTPYLGLFDRTTDEAVTQTPHNVTVPL